jgi:hypothetical protein
VRVSSGMDDAAQLTVVLRAVRASASLLALAGTDPALPMELDPASAHGFVSG